MTRSYSELTKDISQKRRDYIDKRKEEIRRKWFAAPLENKVKASAFRSPVSYCSSASK
jgi:hypothetical protein